MTDLKNNYIRKIIVVYFKFIFLCLHILEKTSRKLQAPEEEVTLPPQVDKVSTDYSDYDFKEQEMVGNLCRAVPRW